MGEWGMCEKKVLNHSGSALIIVLLVLIALSILGYACIHSGIIELKISSNERQMRESFYLAESAAMEGIQRLASMRFEDLDEQIAAWHHPGATSGSRLNFRHPSEWIKEGETENWNCIAGAIDPDTFIAAMEWKVAAAGSLVMTESRLIQHRVYGLCTKYAADNLVEIGFNIRY
jgi:Tfp pilus assembly protein PilX